MASIYSNIYIAGCITVLNNAKNAKVLCHVKFLEFCKGKISCMGKEVGGETAFMIISITSELK